MQRIKVGSKEHTHFVRCSFSDRCCNNGDAGRAWSAAGLLADLIVVRGGESPRIHEYTTIQFASGQCFHIVAVVLPRPVVVC